MTVSLAVRFAERLVEAGLLGYVGRPVTPEQRIEAFRKVVGERPQDAFARYSLAMSYRAAGRDLEAVQEFDELLRREPGYVPTYLMLGQVHEALGHAEAAAQAYGSGIAVAARANNEHARSELQQALESLRTRGAIRGMAGEENPAGGGTGGAPAAPAGHGLLAGKRALITGVANDRSIAWAVAQAFHRNGAELAFTYPGEAMGKRVLPLVQPVARAVLDCDVSRDEEIDRTVAAIAARWDRLDVLVHSIAYAPREAMAGRFTDVTSREAWRIALDVSAYSLVGLARAFKPLLKPGASIVTITYYGAEKVVTNYNVMGVAKAALECSVRYLAQDLGQDGIRVNAISAGPLKTLAAAGIKGMRAMLGENAARTPLLRNIDHEDVGDAALYLCSDLARNVTGETLHVDAGQNILASVGMA